MGALTVRRELRAAIALAEVDGLGPRRIAALVEACGSAGRALAEVSAGRVPPIDDPEGRIRFSGELRTRLRGLRPISLDALLDLESRGVRVVARGGPGYPERLEHLPDPPAVLWLRGAGALPGGPAVAVVGTRSSTEYGRRVARDLAAGLASRRVTVVSGMALGIDGAAHRGALEAGGPTVGVLGSGLDRPYPRAHHRLFDRMRCQGLLASEFPPREGPRRGYFPRRNRVIAALADAVVVVQAGERSGALITADHAMELGRDVLGVPGRVDVPESAGVHALLRDGAGVATGVADVLQALGLEASAAPGKDGVGGRGPPPNQEGPGALVWRRLERGPRPADELAAALGLPTGRALAVLTRLELAGVVRALPGGRYERAEASIDPSRPAGRGWNASERGAYR